MNNSIPAVEKTLAILEYLAKMPHGATQAELKRSLNISMSTAYRILQTLLANQYVRKNDDATYEMDIGFLPLLCHFRERLGFLEHARNMIDQLSARHEIACKLSIRRGMEQVTVLRAEPDGPVALTGQAGSCFPLIEGSVGAALLSGFANEEIMGFVKSCRVDIAEKRDPSLLVHLVEEVRKQGYALNVRKNRWNIAAMSMPVLDASSSVIAAITLIGTETDFAGGKLSLLKDALHKAAKQLFK